MLRSNVYDTLIVQGEVYYDSQGLACTRGTLWVDTLSMDLLSSKPSRYW